MSGMTEQQERALRDGLRALARTTRGASASASVERAVLAEMERRGTPAAPRRAWLAVAAALILLSSAGLWLARQAPPRKTQTATIEPAGFVEVPGAWLLPPLESGAIVRIGLPVAVLPSYGIQIAPEFGRDAVIAELLVAQDGHPRAIRLVNDTHLGSTP